MKERRFRNDWINEVRLDEKTGRDQRVPVYQGAWFRLAPEGRALASKGRIWAPALACGLLLILFFLADDAATRSLPVFLPAAAALFPLLYWMMGAWTSLRTKERFTRLQREKGFGRVLRSSMGCFVFLCIACAADLVRILSGGGTMAGWAGLALLAGAALSAFLAFQRQRKIERHIIEEQREAV